MELIILIVVVLLIASMYGNYNMLNKLERYEDTFKLYDAFVDKKAEDYAQLLERMRLIDSRQMFEKDDDVGGVFDELKKLIEDYNNFE